VGHVFVIERWDPPQADGSMPKFRLHQSYIYEYDLRKWRAELLPKGVVATSGVPVPTSDVPVPTSDVPAATLWRWLTDLDWMLKHAWTAKSTEAWHQLTSVAPEKLTKYEGHEFAGIVLPCVSMVQTRVCPGVLRRVVTNALAALPPAADDAPYSPATSAGVRVAATGASQAARPDRAEADAEAELLPPWNEKPGSADGDCRRLTNAQVRSELLQVIAKLDRAGVPPGCPPT